MKPNRMEKRIEAPIEGQYLNWLRGSSRAGPNLVIEAPKGKGMG